MYNQQGVFMTAIYQHIKDIGASRVGSAKIGAKIFGNLFLSLLPAFFASIYLSSQYCLLATAISIALLTFSLFRCQKEIEEISVGSALFMVITPTYYSFFAWIYMLKGFDKYPMLAYQINVLCVMSIIVLWPCFNIFNNKWKINYWVRCLLGLSGIITFQCLTMGVS